MEKKFMNKLDDMELDMVAGGTRSRVYIPDDHPLYKGFKKGFKKAVDGIENGLKTVTKSVDKLLGKIFGSPRRR